MHAAQVEKNRERTENESNDSKREPSTFRKKNKGGRQNLPVKAAEGC